LLSILASQHDADTDGSKNIQQFVHVD
jgi:hypothetical protein